MSRNFEVVSLGVSDISNQICMSIAHFLWQGILIGVLCEVMVRLARRRSAQLRYGVASAALFLCPVCFVVTFLWTSPKLPSVATHRHDVVSLLAGTRPRETPAANADLPATDSIRNRPFQQNTNSMKGGSLLAADGDSGGDERHVQGSNTQIRSALATCYLLGVVLFLARLASGLWGAFQLRQVSTAIRDSALLQLLQQEAKRLGLKTAPMLATSERVVVPIVIGLLKPVILLPASVATGLSNDEISAILSHELAHIRRFDLWVNFFQRIVEALLFFHPAVWLLSRRVSAEREICCDDLAVSRGHHPVNYAGALLKMSEICVGNSPTSTTSLAASGTANSLFEYRILRLLSLYPLPQGVAVEARISRRRSLGVLLCCAIAFFSLMTAPGLFPFRNDNGQYAGGQPASMAPVPVDDPVDSEESVKPVTKAEKPKWRTEEISISGTVFGLDGDVVAEAHVFAISTNGLVKLGETKTDSAGCYRFVDLPLPISGAESVDFEGDAFGKFVVYAVSPEHGLTWRNEKWFLPDAEPYVSEFVDVEEISRLAGKSPIVLNSPSRFFREDTIRLHLVFQQSEPFKLQLVDDLEKPIPGATVKLRGLKPVDGAVTEFIDSQVMVNGLEFRGFGDARVVPMSLCERQTDEDGWFEFSHLPTNCQFQIDVAADGFADRRVNGATGNRIRADRQSHQEYLRTEEVLTLPQSVAVAVTVTYADTGEPAPNVFVSAASLTGLGDTWRISDQLGKVQLLLPCGDCRFVVLPESGTPYTFIDGEELKYTVDSEEEHRLSIPLQRAAEVKLKVIDSTNGAVIPGMALWVASPKVSGEPKRHKWRNFQLPNLVRQGAVKSGEDGVIQTYFKPGKYVLSVSNHRGSALPEFGDGDSVEVHFTTDRKNSLTLERSPDGTLKLAAPQSAM